MPLGVTFVQETTVFREFGPLAGNTMRLSLRDGAEDRQLARRVRRSTSMRATTSASARPACWRCARAASRAGARRRTSSTSAATPRCAATSTCEFVGDHVGVLQRRAALPADRGDADADRRARRHPRRVLRQPGRRPLRAAQPFKWCLEQARSSTRRSSATARSTLRNPGADLRPAADRRAASGSWTRAPPTASASRPSRSASPSTSTGRGRRCSTRTGRTLLFAVVRRQRASSASRSSRSGLATTSEGNGQASSRASGNQERPEVCRCLSEAGPLLSSEFFSSRSSLCSRSIDTR